MKTIIPSSRTFLASTSLITGLLLAGLASAQPGADPTPKVQTRTMVVSSAGTGADAENQPPGAGASSRKLIRIESIQPGQNKESTREVTWLGVSTEEMSEALASQLGLKSGQGLVVIFVAPDSPAAKAGIQKYDVIEELGDQMLVDPVQLRKLVQMQKAGDAVNLTLHRGGKKQTASATLAKRTENLSLSTDALGFGGLSELGSAGGGGGNWTFGTDQAPGAFAGMTKKMVNIEVQRNMEEARKAIQEALRQSAQAGRAARSSAPLPPIAPPPPALPPLVDVGNNATVTVTKDGNAVKTVVKSDDTGILVIVANPKKHLTAHDQDGKLLFDGEIETPEQQQKVPEQLWEKVKPLLQQIKPGEEGEPEPHTQSNGEPTPEAEPEEGAPV